MPDTSSPLGMVGMKGCGGCNTISTTWLRLGDRFTLQLQLCVGRKMPGLFIHAAGKYAMKMRPSYCFANTTRKLANNGGKKEIQKEAFAYFFLHSSLASTYCFPQVRGKTTGKSMAGQQEQKSG